MADQHRPPAPNGQVLSLVSALSTPQNHELHVQAIRARDEALSSSPESYSNLCLQLAYAMCGCDDSTLLQRIAPADLQAWKATDPSSVMRLQEDPTLWVPFGQMAGLILKNALLHPPIVHSQVYNLQPPSADHVKETLLYALGCQHKELRAVASSIIASCAVSDDCLQPTLYLTAWPRLVPTLVENLKSHGHVEGSLVTIRKIMEDNPIILGEELDAVIPSLVQYLSSTQESHKVAALQSLVHVLLHDIMPTALVLQFQEYLTRLGQLATDPSPAVRKLVCKSIVALLEYRTEYIANNLQPVCQFMLQSTNDIKHADVALEACEFWLAFASLDEAKVTSPMVETVHSFLPQLVPVLLQGMVYSPEQQVEILARNEMDQDESSHNIKPVFHKSRAKHSGGNANNHDADSDEEDGYTQDDEDGFDDDDDGNEWTLRKCSAASLDALSNCFGADPILPYLLPALEQGLSSHDQWIQEASILALGAVAEGCGLEMSSSMGQLHPYLMNLLAQPEGPTSLPQLKVIAAWTVGRYAPWAVEQVQAGTQGHLLAQMTEVFLNRLGDRNRRVQVAVCSAFGVLVEIAGDLLAPYLEHIFQAFVAVMSRYQGRSLLMVFDVLGIMAECCGPAIAEGGLPSIYVPPLIRMWDGLAKNDPTDRTLLPLMESLASISMTSGMNYQPYALETFENAMCIIESVTLLLTASGEKIDNEEDADPITCAADLLDGLVEGMGENFQALVSSSKRYGQHFLNVLLSLSKHEIPGVRMSAMALLGDLARNAPGLLEPALPHLIQEAIANMDPVQPTVSTNAVWAMGEICVRCEGNDSILAPYAPSLMQNLISLLMGNGPGNHGRGSDIPGLAENASACVGRLAKVNPNFVAPDLPRFLLGWCDGMAKIVDPTERRDAYQGFIKTVYVNPQALEQAAANVADAIVAILFCVVTWHIPADLPELSPALLQGDYSFRPFPQQEAELGAALVKLVQDMKASVGEEKWNDVQKRLPVNLRRLLRENYNL